MEMPEEYILQKTMTRAIALPDMEIPNHKDFTVYIDAEIFREAAADAIGLSNTASTNQSIEISPTLQTMDLSGDVTFGANKYQFKNARLHAALSFGGTYFSVTLRVKDKMGTPPKPAKRPATGYLKRLLPADWKSACKLCQLSCLNEKDDFAPVPYDRKSTYATNLCSVGEILFNEIFPSSSAKAAGLVLITGGTGSGKTTILNSLLAQYLYLGPLWDPKRRPHILCIGDPVETTFYAGSEVKIGRGASARMLSGLVVGGYKQANGTNLNRPIDFTARIIGTDVSSVEHGLRDALRETTTACVVSELRTDTDFEAILNFAATGQLVFATAHNTSLVDAMRKLMKFSGSEGSASNRSLLAQRLRAVIHLRPFNVPGYFGAKSKIAPAITLPSVWLGNSSGIRNFVCDGMAAILPHGYSIDHDSSEGTLGLAWAAQQLIEDGTIPRAASDSLLKKAHELDFSAR